jgi:hypothetical protein
MDTLVAVSTALISALTSAAVTLVFQSYLAKKIEHQLARELEKYKSELDVRVAAEKGLVNRRLDGYPKIVELAYRTRNMARDLVGLAPPSQALLDELRARARELEDCVYRFRIDLEADHVFVAVHRHKNLILEFYRAASEQRAAERTTAEPALAMIIQSIERSYGEVVASLSDDLIYH